MSKFESGSDPESKQPRSWWVKESRLLVFAAAEEQMKGFHVGKTLPASSSTSSTADVWSLSESSEFLLLLLRAAWMLQSD